MSDRTQLLALYQACFPEDEPSFWQWIFTHVYTAENTLNIRENGRIVSSLQMIPCELTLNSVVYKAHYIYAAATLPAYQGKGLMAGLLAQAAEEGIRRGHDFSVLITQEDSLLDYYARFGYQPKCLFGMGHGENPQRDAEVRIAEKADIPTLNQLYEQAANGLLHGLRDQSHWERQLELFGAGAQLLLQNGRIAAYAFSDERGILEAMGPDAAVLAAHIQPGKPWRTLPGENVRPMGSVKPLNENSQKILEQNSCYLNLMYN